MDAALIGEARDQMQALVKNFPPYLVHLQRHQHAPTNLEPPAVV
jgi:hypothetical protein